MKTPHDDKIDAFAYSLAREGKPEYLPQLYETEDEPEAEPVEWPKENPLLNLKPLPEIKETDDIIDLFGQTAEAKRQTMKAAEELAALAYACEELQPIIESLAEMLKPVLAEIADIIEEMLNLYPNKRVKHLAKHAKKARTRKKNINRIIKHLTTAQSGPR